MAAGSTSGRQRGLMKKVVLLVLGFSLLWSSAASADLFLKFTGIDGESTEFHHPHWSVISNVSWGVSIATSGGGGGMGQPVFLDLKWDQMVDTSWGPLLNEALMGRHIPTATVDFVAPGAVNQTYFQMVFDGVTITSLDLSGHSTGKATFAGAFAYDRIEMTYWETMPNGSQGPPITASYDLRTHMGSIGNLGLLYGLGLAGPSNAVVPIPASLWLLGSGLAGLAGLRRFRKT
jgi:type VI protein secretion system component Hcp